MNHCLQLKKSNCKNCYKCIRNCPVKSIRFSEHQAHIVEQECILCGMCFVTCPQNAKQIRKDTIRAKELLQSGNPVYVSIAPSFVSNFKGYGITALSRALRQLGFTGVEETAVGAAIVKKEYERIIGTGEKNVLISSCCHSVNLLIQKHRPEALPYLAKVMSPMQAHCAKLKREHPGCHAIFIGPCIAKKDEGDQSSELVDCVLTFEELEEWMEEKNVHLEDVTDDGEKGRTRLFPTAGGIIRSMELDKNFNYITIDGVENCIDALDDITSGALKNCFIEMSACKGSCINGPVMGRRHHNPIRDFITVNQFAGPADFSLVEHDFVVDKEFQYLGLPKQMPGSTAISEILCKMGKQSKEQELNCGTCGYNTCRDKAVAVLLGKADLTMCLPFLKEKAESFSDKIINNTPNGIIVLNEQLETQQINQAARDILNITNAADILGKPVELVLDPADYWIALNNEENIHEKPKYLAGYKKYVEETIIYDKEYHIVMIIMKDITEAESIKISRDKQCRQAIEITDKVVEKQMRVVQEIASLLGETTAETKIALTRLKESLANE